MPSSSRANRVAIVGASSLRGRELKQVLEDRNFPADQIVLLDESVMTGTLTEAGGEPTFIRSLDEDSFDGVRFAFFAGTAFDAEKNWLVAQRAGATVIDLTGAVTTSGRAISWIPSLDSALPPRAGLSANGSAQPAPYFSPPSPVLIACTLAAGLIKFPTQRLVLVLFPPVSERDQAGVEELESQTTNLLSFKPIQQTIFDTQVAFNLLSRYGEESKPALADVRNGIVADVTRYLAGRAPTPAIQLVQAPVFYGYAFSAFAELKSAEPPEGIETALVQLGIKVDASNDVPSSNVSVAGESEIHIAPIELDTPTATGLWIWGVADHLRLASANAVRIAENLISKSVV